jgi:uncharacterized membrane protein YhhN
VPLLTLIGAGLALVFWMAFCWRRSGWTRSVVKTGSVAVLALAAAGQGLPVLAAALALGALGDFCLSRVGARWFLAGMAAFGAAHLAYTVLMLDGAALPGRWPAMIALGLFGAFMVGLLWRRSGAPRGPVLAYVAVILAMGMVALALGDAPWWRLVTLSALLFVVSDSLLAAELFLVPRRHPARRVLPFLVWPTYWLAQAGLLWGLTHGAIN